MPTLTLKIDVLIRCILRETRSPEMNVDPRYHFYISERNVKPKKKH